MIKKVALFTFQNKKTAIEQYRFYSPLKHAGIEVIDGVVDGEVKPLVIQECDLVLTQRDFAGSFEDYMAISWIAKSAGKPFVLDLDDNLLSLPKDHPDRISHYYSSALPGLLHGMIEADLVTVATENLKNELLELNPNISVLPNYFDPTLWEIKDQTPPNNDEPVRILYMGSHTHKPDLEIINKTLFQVAKNANRKVKFTFIGVEPPAGLKNFARVEEIMDFSFVYEDFVEKFSRIEADIALAPLRDNTFNRSKSPIKFFEYSAIGLPTVASAVEPYTKVINEGQTGLLATNEAEWVEKITLLIENTELRKELVHNARASINENYLITKHANSWKEAYEGITLPEDNRQLDRTAIVEFLAGVAQQSSEQEVKNKTEQRMAEKTIDQLESKNKDLLVRIDALKAKVAAKDEELTQLSLSLNNAKREAEKTIDQLESKNKDLLVRIDALKAKVAAKDEELTQLSWSLNNAKLEIVDYSTSTSWKMTRLFRRVGRWINRRKNDKPV